MWTPSGQTVLFEIYCRYDAVTARTGQLWRGFAGVTVSSLLLLIVLHAAVLWRLLDRVERAQEQREVLLQRAVDASAEERRRIAGTLHDGVVQELAADVVRLAGAAERAASRRAAVWPSSCSSAAATVRASIGGLRSLLVDIYPPSLRTAGLAAALTDLAGAAALARTSTSVSTAAGRLDGLAEEDERLVYRVAQECLRNAAPPRRRRAGRRARSSRRRGGVACGRATTVSASTSRPGAGQAAGGALRPAGHRRPRRRGRAALARVSSTPGAGTAGG